MLTARNRLILLSAPLGVVLPEEYFVYMESPLRRGIIVRHLRSRNDPPSEWWPATVECLEADIWNEQWTRRAPNAHFMRETAQPYLNGGHESLPGPEGTRFATTRLARGFWIGEVDGDSVFLDQETGGVFAFLSHEDCVERWASSFSEFVEHGQVSGRWV